jgi:hypothetical protein
MWAAMNGHTDVVQALIANGADVGAKEKVSSSYCVSTGVVRANDERMFGTGLRDLGATGRKCPMHCSCGVCDYDKLTIVPLCVQNVLHSRALMAHSWCFSA